MVLSLLLSQADAPVAQAAVDSNQQIVLALIAVVATSVAALVFVIRNTTISKVAAEQATQANEAVNNVGPGQHRLYDKITSIEKSVTRLLRDQETFDSHGWETLPADLNTAVALTQTIRDLQNNHKSFNDKIDTLISELREHVVWEMDAKYGRHGQDG